MVCEEKCIRHISQYLDVTIGKLSCDKNGNMVLCKGPNSDISGFGTIITSLARSAKLPQFGKDREDEAMVRQWVEYASCYVCSLEAQSQQILKELNEVLSTQAYFIGNYQSLADAVFYCILYDIMANMTLQDKEKFMHVSRWFANVQQDSSVRQKNKLLHFSRTPLYT